MPPTADALRDAIAARGWTLDAGVLRGDGWRLQADEPALLLAATQHGVNAALDALAARARGLPPWFVARSGLLLSLEARSDAIEPHLHVPLTDDTAAVLAYVDPKDLVVTWLTRDHVSAWQVPLSEVHDAALRSLDRRLDAATLRLEHSGGARLAMLETDAPLKAPLLLAPSLRSKVEPLLGWPVLAVAPCRDFVFLVAEDDLDPAQALLARAVVTEHEQASWPVTRELLRLSDAGVEALGRFEADA